MILGKVPSRSSLGIVYVLELDLEDKLLVKVGYTTRAKVEERVCEILTSVWKKYRIFPKCYVKRYKSVDSPKSMEKTMHNALEGSRYTTQYKFSGSTEIFDIPLEEVVELYDRIINGEEP